MISDHQEECSHQEPAHDEPVQRSVDLDDLDDVDDMDDLDMGIVAQNGKDEVEGIGPPSHYVSPSRSHSRLTRLETNRVSTSMFGFIFVSVFSSILWILIPTLFLKGPS